MAVGPATSDTVYEPVPFWAKIPHGLWLKEATSVAVDADDRVYVFNRGNAPVMVFDRDGNMIDSWGNETPFIGTELFEDPYGNMMPRWKGNRFMRAHAITVDSEENLWLVDDLGNKITKTDKKGNTLMTLGTGSPSGFQSGDPFNRPTDVAISPKTGDIFVSDGYRNSRVHRYDKSGNHIKSWGEPGTDPGQFSLPHNIAMFGDDAVIVCDRENHRVQVFTIDGEWLNSWHPTRPWPSTPVRATTRTSTWPSRDRRRSSTASATWATRSRSTIAMASGSRSSGRRCQARGRISSTGCTAWRWTRRAVCTRPRSRTWRSAAS